MKVIYELKDEEKSYAKDMLKGLINYINKRYGDLETLLNNYNRCGSDFTWYKNPLTITPLFVSYGAIGYSIDYRGYEVHVDNELNEITIM